MSLLCTVLRVSLSGLYEWKNRVESAHTTWRQKIGDLIEVFLDATEQTYGYRRIHADLVFNGVQIDDDTVRKIMRERGLTPYQPGPKRLVTTIAADAGNLPDLVRRDFAAEAPGRKLCGDIRLFNSESAWSLVGVSGGVHNMYAGPGCDHGSSYTTEPTPHDPWPSLLPNTATSPWGGSATLFSLQEQFK